MYTYLDLRPGADAVEPEFGAEPRAENAHEYGDTTVGLLQAAGIIEAREVCLRVLSVEYRVGAPHARICADAGPGEPRERWLLYIDQGAFEFTPPSSQRPLLVGGHAWHRYKRPAGVIVALDKRISVRRNAHLSGPMEVFHVATVNNIFEPGDHPWDPSLNWPRGRPQPDTIAGPVNDKLMAGLWDLLMKQSS